MFFNRANFAFIASKLLLLLSPLLSLNKDDEDFDFGGEGFRRLPEDEDFMLRSLSRRDARERPLEVVSKLFPLRSGEWILGTRRREGDVLVLTGDDVVVVMSFGFTTDVLPPLPMNRARSF